MKMPRKPPSVGELLETLPAERLAAVLMAIPTIAINKKYLHWDKLIRYPLPEGLISHEEWWLVTKLGQTKFYKEIPLYDDARQPFRYLVVDPMLQWLHEIDLGAGSQKGVSTFVTIPDSRNHYYISSLIEEAITSSQLEGATTTRRVAKEMLQAARLPRNRSERMIFNNYQTMQAIGDLKGQPLTRKIVFELHRLVTDGTLSDSSAAGRFRRDDEEIIIGDESDTVLHTPPPAVELEARLEQMCAFANGDTPGEFLHPALRSIILHFWMGYDHPFVDGNGRTARALFYWSMLHHGFWLFEYISISRILLKAPSKYGRAFLYTETDDNDLTYFILHQIDVLRKAVDELHVYINVKTQQQQAAEQEMQGLAQFNHRQRALLSHALRHSHFRYSIEGHRRSHSVVYETARTDLMELATSGLLTIQKQGRAWQFFAASDLEKRLKSQNA